MKERLTDDLVAIRAARELKPGDYCNLGIGLPQLCASYVSSGVMVQSENGLLGYGPLITLDNLEALDPDYQDAGGYFVTRAPGMSVFDQLTAFIMIRSRRLTSIIGGLQVSENGDVAIHSLGTGDIYPQIGGSMDLAWGAKRLIVTMTHISKDGSPKILRKLSLPVTARGCVNLLITDIAVMAVTSRGLLLKEVAATWTTDEVQALTAAPLMIAPDLKEIEF